MLEALRADVYARMGWIDRADAEIDGALDICARTGEVWPEAELHRRKGELQRADAVAAEQHFQRALAVAQSQGAKLFELRASLGLARLWLEDGRKRAAQTLLEPICSWFTEGLDGPDLSEARTLWDALTRL